MMLVGGGNGIRGWGKGGIPLQGSGISRGYSTRHNMAGREMDAKGAKQEGSEEVGGT